MPLEDGAPETGEGAIAESLAASDVNPAPESSPGSKGGETPSYLDTVTAVLNGGTEKSPGSEDGKGKPEPESTTGTDGDPDVPEEIQQLHPKTRDRFHELVTMRKAVEAERDALKPKAEQFERVLDYLETNRIAPQEFDNALELTRMIKSGEYEKALEVLTPIFREVADRAGRILPADLQERVRLGHITEEDARELHRSRTHAKNVETRTAEERERDQQNRQAEEAKRVAETAAQAGDQWAKEKAASDPDWRLKQNLVAEQVELDITRRKLAGDPNWFPKTREDVIRISNAALKVVEDRLKKMGPRPVEKRVVTGLPASSRAAAQPKTFMEAVDQALASAGK